MIARLKADLHPRAPKASIRPVGIRRLLPVSFCAIRTRLRWEANRPWKDIPHRKGTWDCPEFYTKTIPAPRCIRRRPVQKRRGWLRRGRNVAPARASTPAAVRGSERPLHAPPPSSYEHLSARDGRSRGGKRERTPGGERRAQRQHPSATPGRTLARRGFAGQSASAVPVRPVLDGSLSRSMARRRFRRASRVSQRKATSRLCCAGNGFGHSGRSDCR